MKAKASQLPTDVLESIENPDPLQGEDIIIERDNGEIAGVIIQPEAYNFFIKKYEKPPTQFEFTWEGGLSELKNKYSSVDLQHQPMEWR